MIVFFRTLTGRVVTLDITVQMTILDLKVRIHRETSGEIFPIFLVFAGKVLEEHRKVEYYGINSECNVFAFAASGEYHADRAFCM
mmetsp:Transcript_62027/g.71101  ORF Transcript_62027/g.71101 Transcript_62027/m.71101 type:complete len:85 (-) Transcript_62027:47-301(-)